MPGSMRSVSIAGRYFSVTADADGSRSLGGFDSELQMNGDGSARKVMTRVGWEVTGLTLNVNDINDDQEFLQSVANSADFVPISFTSNENTTYDGLGSIFVKISKSTMSGNASVDFMGPDTLEKQ